MWHERAEPPGFIGFQKPIPGTWRAGYSCALYTRVDTLGNTFIFAWGMGVRALHFLGLLNPRNPSHDEAEAGGHTASVQTKKTAASPSPASAPASIRLHQPALYTRWHNGFFRRKHRAISAGGAVLFPWHMYFRVLCWLHSLCKRPPSPSPFPLCASLPCHLLQF